MKPSFFLAGILLMTSVLLAFSPMTTRADGCSSYRVYPDFFVCQLVAEGQYYCAYGQGDLYCIDLLGF